MKEYRMCENPICGHKNDLSFMECIECGATLEGVIVTMEKDEPPPPHLDEPEEPAKEAEGQVRGTQTLRKIKLVSTKDGFEIPIPVLGCLIGMQGDVFPEYFSRGAHAYVSNRHARIVLKEDSYVVVDESRNGTTINNRPLIKGRECKVEVGDRIVFADMEFMVEEWK